MNEGEEVLELGEVETEERDVLEIYLAEVARIPLLEEKEEQELAQRMREGDLRARERLIVSHLRLVASEARQYGDVGLDLLDLIQEGNLGLIEAVDRFDPHRGARLSTYALFWIRKAMGQAIERQAQMIRIPSHLFRAILRFQKLKASFGAEGVEEWGEVLTAPGLSLARVLEVERTVGEVMSLDTPVLEEEGGESLEELVSDEKTAPPELAALQELFREELMEILSCLPPREAQILRWRYGLEGVRPQSLAEIALSLGVSRERVRQLEVRALKNLKEKWGREALEFYRRLITAQ